jgi:hypothetical protein
MAVHVNTPELVRDGVTFTTKGLKVGVAPGLQLSHAGVDKVNTEER